MHASTVNVYFSQSVNWSYVAPGGTPAQGSQNISAAFINRINSATESIDVCMSTLKPESDDVVTALIAAASKPTPVAVRVIIDQVGYGYPEPTPTPGYVITNPRVQQLVNAGIPVQCDPTGGNAYDMHNKFAVFDGGGSSLDDDWVWAASLHWFESEPGTG